MIKWINRGVPKDRVGFGSGGTMGGESFLVRALSVSSFSIKSMKWSTTCGFVFGIQWERDLQHHQHGTTTTWPDIYIYIHTHTHTHTHIYIYIYIFI